MIHTVAAIIGGGPAGGGLLCSEMPSGVHISDVSECDEDTPVYKVLISWDNPNGRDVLIEAMYVNGVLDGLFPLDIGNQTSFEREIAAFAPFEVYALLRLKCLNGQYGPSVQTPTVIVNALICS